MLILGIDAATWKMITPNLNLLPNFKKLMEEGEHKKLGLNMKPLSAIVWCSMFSGKTPEEHGHINFVIDGILMKRKDIQVDFIWDILDREGYNVKALNIPFVYPPYNFKCKHQPLNYGLSFKLDELDEDQDRLLRKAKEILQEKPDLFIVVFEQLDKVQHFHWGEPVVLEWYKKMDKVLGELAFEDGKVIIVSDHGFCDIDETNTRTKHPLMQEEVLKGAHDDDAILITKNIGYNITKVTDIFYAIRSEISKEA